MPIYEYIGPGCKAKFELLRLMSQAGEKAPCPRCHSRAERTLSAVACFSRGESGLTSSTSGNPCSSCSLSSCDSCAL